MTTNHQRKSASKLLALLPGTLCAEPILSSWDTAGSNRHARIRATRSQQPTDRSGGGTTPLTIWDYQDYSSLGVIIGDQAEHPSHHHLCELSPTF